MSLPAAADKRQFVESMFDDIAPRYDFMNRVMTLGIDRGWRRAAVSGLGLEPGSRVIDLGCGTGDLSVDLANAGGVVTGVDLSAEMLVRAHARLQSAGFLRADVQRMPFADNSFDAAVSGFALRNFSAQAVALVEASRVLRPGGRLAILEVHLPRALPLRAGFRAYFTKVVPFLGSLLSSGYAYKYLAESLEYLPSDSELAEMLTAAGFIDVQQRLFLGHAAQLVTAVKSG